MGQINLPALIDTSSAEETFVLGQNLAAFLEKGSIVALSGPLGAGKTLLAKGIGRGLGIKEELSSPTYTIVSEYEACLAGECVPFYHIDAWRLGGDDDFSSIGGEEIVFGNGISLIEWSERIGSFIPDNALRVSIEITGDEKRRFHICRAKNHKMGENQ
ncbi:MAG: tRNA (adenosine(37)-N6)-threonylcarbamoyltransferase complex ATPase subunit type 1 TsaE [Treponema sp.]|nr:tRNA (adenosine(37)-N6)-threonylcarbamoyltransferase complex ATPase subunit type 1 TsaE [Treponema sp.]